MTARSLLAARCDELIGAGMLLTRLPVARLSRANPAPGACIWAYPVVGAAVGAVSGLVYWLATLLGAPPAIAAIWAVAALILTTGGLHEDGLADTADGFGGGRDPARKLDIMRDSRIGSYGALALMLSLSLRVSAVAALREPGTVAWSLIGAGMLGRGAMIGMVLLLTPARPDGMAAALNAVPPVTAIAGLAIAASAALLPGGLASLAASCLALVAMAGLARRQIGGFTGDVLGATEQLAECLVLTAQFIR